MKEVETRTGRISRAAASLFPGYFALVMATGIISIAAFMLEIKWLATVAARSRKFKAKIPS